MLLNYFLILSKDLYSLLTYYTSLLIKIWVVYINDFVQKIPFLSVLSLYFINNFICTRYAMLAKLLALSFGKILRKILNTSLKFVDYFYSSNYSNLLLINNSPLSIYYFVEPNFIPYLLLIYISDCV